MIKVENIIPVKYNLGGLTVNCPLPTIVRIKRSK